MVFVVGVFRDTVCCLCCCWLCLVIVARCCYIALLLLCCRLFVLVSDVVVYRCLVSMFVDHRCCLLFVGYACWHCMFAMLVGMCSLVFFVWSCF